MGLWYIVLGALLIYGIVEEASRRNRKALRRVEIKLDRILTQLESRDAAGEGPASTV